MNKNNDNLNSNVNRAIRTTFIGAIAQFEKSFGYLWGHNKDRYTLTDSEKNFLRLWLPTRNAVLDCGNEQSRVIDREFRKFTVTKNTYKSQSSCNTRIDPETGEINYNYVFDVKPR